MSFLLERNQKTNEEWKSYLEDFIKRSKKLKDKQLDHLKNIVDAEIFIAKKELEKISGIYG